MVVKIMTDITELDNLKSLADIIEHRCLNLQLSQQLLSDDLSKLYTTKSKRSRDKICLNIAIKMDFIEILLSKIIDDIMLLEIIEYDNTLGTSAPQQKKDEYLHYQ